MAGNRNTLKRKVINYPIEWHKDIQKLRKQKGVAYDSNIIQMAIKEFLDRNVESKTAKLA